jgi:CBS domain-containing protein
MSYEDIMKYTKTYTEHLVSFGYPICDGNIMVSNPFWVQNSTTFKETIFNWIHKPSEENYMNLAIFYDAVSIAGDDKLLLKLKEYLFVICENAPAFYPYFAKPTLNFETPLGLFSDFIVDKELHKDELDIKKGGIFPIVHGTRTLAIENNLQETNTVERLKKINDLGIIDREFTNELIESFNFLLTLRLKFRLEKIGKRENLDNYINPSKLTMLEKDLLKDSFKIVNKFKKFITYHCKLNMLS